MGARNFREYSRDRARNRKELNFFFFFFCPDSEEKSKFRFEWQGQGEGRSIYWIPRSFNGSRSEKLHGTVSVRRTFEFQSEPTEKVWKFLFFLLSFSFSFSLFFLIKWILQQKATNENSSLEVPSLQKSGDKIEFSLTRHALADRSWQFCVLRISTIPRIVRRFKLHFIAAVHCGQRERRLFSPFQRGKEGFTNSILDPNANFSFLPRLGRPHKRACLRYLIIKAVFILLP